MTDADQRGKQVLDGLDPEQRAAALAPPGPVCILAGAGTGKTRAITRRIAYLVVTEQVASTEVLAVTHSNRAAGELRDRIQSLGVSVQARTFHSAAISQLRYFWAETGLPGDRLKMIHDADGSQRKLLHAALKAEVPSTVFTDVHDLKAEIEWARTSRVTPSVYAAAAKEAGRMRNLPVEALAAAFARYEHLKRSHGVLDFSDTIEQCALLLEQNADVADQVRQRYRCFVVDEYQDTDLAQQRLLAAWLGPGNNVTVVGDPNQAIYSFKGADPSLLVGFAGHYPGSVSISLNRDYRSTPQIVGAANRLMAQASAGGTLQGQRPAGSEPVLRTFDSEADEAAALAGRVNELIAEGVTASEIAVLVRTRIQVEFYRTALQHAGVVTEVLDDEKFFERPEIRRVVGSLTDLAGRSPQVGGSAGLRVPGRHRFDPGVPPPGLGAARAEWDASGALVRLADGLPDRARGTAEAPVSELQHRAKAEHAPRGSGGVTVATIHQAKGLEWDAVLLPGLTEGFLPIVHATSPEETEEERRLLYVAVTRAREWLELSYASSSDKGYNNQPSRFLNQIFSRKNPSTTTAAQTRSAYSTGDRVLSAAFGMGRVIEVGMTEMKIDFGGSYGVKTLSVTDRDLSKL